MDKKVLTEEVLRKLVRRVIEEQETMMDDETTTEEGKVETFSHPLAKKTFNDVKGHLQNTVGAFSLKDVSTSENLEDDNLKKTWKWKTNSSKVDVVVTLDVKMRNTK
tara:strand:+ start:3681 stop:4001 length:321 start_codon:yes stop_codon:yes gene_type:complete